MVKIDDYILSDYLKMIVPEIGRTKPEGLTAGGIPRDIVKPVIYRIHFQEIGVDGPGV